MNKKVYILKSIIVSFLIFLVLGCGHRSGNKNNSNSGKEGLSYQDSSDGAMQDGMIEIVDLAGRTVTVPTGDVKVILGESFMIYAVAPLFGKDGNPFEHIVGWTNLLKKFDPDTYEMYVEKFPEVSKIINLGRLHKGGFSIEKVMDLNADILFLNLHHLKPAQDMGLIEKLDKINIKIVFVDFGKYPTEYVIPSMLLLGQIFQKTAKASEFVNFCFAQMQRVYSVVDKIEKNKKPLVFTERMAIGGWTKANEYRVFGSTYMGRLVELAGGRNYGGEAFGNKYTVTINAEQLFEIDPDMIIGASGNRSKVRSDTEAISLGYKAIKKDIRDGIKAMVSRTGWETLTAVQKKKVHIIHSAFSYSPVYFIPVQQIAKWLYPDKFTDLNPEKTFIEFHNKFLPIDYSGMFWASLE